MRVSSSLALLLLVGSSHAKLSPEKSLMASKPTRSRAAALTAGSRSPPTVKVVVENPVATLVSSTRGGAAPTTSKNSTVNSVLFGLVAATIVAYLKSSGAPVAVSSGGGDASANKFVSGMFYSGIALVGNTGVSSLRKVMAQYVKPAQQIGVSTLMQGTVALALTWKSGALGKLTLTKSFWVAAVASSCLNALVKTLETKAFAESEMSLCAPFLAFDPVMQFIVGTCVIPLTCSYFSLGCAELKGSIPLHHILGVATIASSAFALGQAGAAGSTKEALSSGKEGKVSKKAQAVKMLGPLPVGSWLILFNCFVYGFTFRLDKAAVNAASKEVYYMYGRLIMAATTLSGAAMGNLASRRSAVSQGGDGGEGAEVEGFFAPFKNPKVFALLLGVCCLDAVYMLSLYKAVTLISPVYVAAIKRGGGVLLSSVVGATCFGESLTGRGPPILAITAGVVLLCMK